MRIFISYSTPDIKIVKQLASYLRPYGDVKYWEENKELGKEAWDTIFSWIDSSDAVIVLITDSTVARGLAVGGEVGRAKGKDKFIIPIVSSTVPNTELAFMSGITYQQIDTSNPFPAIIQITQAIQKLSGDFDQKRNAAIALGVFAIIWLISSD